MTSGTSRLTIAALFAASVLLSWAFSWLVAARGVGRAEDPSPFLPPEGLRASVAGRDVAGAVRTLRGVPVYRGLAARLAPAVDALEPGSSGAVGLYSRGWARVTAPRSGSARWEVVTSDGRIDPATRRSDVPRRDLPARGVALRIEPSSLLGERATSHPIAALAARGLPGPLLGTTIPDARSGLTERWEIACPPGSGLDVLSRLAVEGVEARGWAVVPPEPDTIVWLRVDPVRFASGAGSESQPIRSLEPLERFLDLPLRDALARSLAGPALLVFEEPVANRPPRALASFDLSGPETARTTLDRIFALGMIADALDVRLYRGARIAAWRPREGGPEGPAIALDTDLLLVAPTAREIRDAIDRRRDGSGGGRALRARLESLPRGNWKGWSRSAYLAAAWEEILGGWESTGNPGRVEVTSVGGFEGRSFVLESRGTAPAFAGEPIVPVLRGVWRRSLRTASGP